MMSESLIGKQLANFKIERLLGQGGMAEVYFGRDVSLQRPVAIKVINAQFRDNPAYADRFISEARAVASWRHENIVQVYYAGKQEYLYYFVMEYIDGMDLASVLSQYAAEGELMPHEDVLKIGYAVARALDYAHKKGVIHRDIKPANTMISTDDRVVLMDFGLALDVQQGSIGEVFGTPHYVSPEQARRSADAVPQSDVYSLGIMIYEMLTGVVPFDDPSPTAVALQHLSMSPPSPRSLNQALSIHVERVLLKALEKDPKNRYQSASEFMDALDAVLSSKAAVLNVAEFPKLELPPLPPGMEPPNRTLSSQSVAERVILNINQTNTQPKPPEPRIPETQRAQPAVPKPVPSMAQPPTAPLPRTQAGGKSMLWIGLAIGAVLLLVGGVVGFMVMSGGDDVPASAQLPTLAPTESIVESTPTLEPPPSVTPIPPTDTPPSVTPIAPTDTLPSVTPIPPTAIPPTEAVAVVPVVLPTETSLPPSPVPPSPTPPLQPTVLYPDGQVIRFLWNDNSFYWNNPTGASLRVSPLNFEALDANGNSLGYAFEGIRWTLGFSSVESNKCVAIELLQTTDWLRPAQCNRGYNSTLTLQRTDAQVFWLPRDGVTQFRAIWSGQEVGRCDVLAFVCEVRIP